MCQHSKTWIKTFLKQLSLHSLRMEIEKQAKKKLKQNYVGIKYEKNLPKKTVDSNSNN